MAKTICSGCRLKAKYDYNPKSIIGRLWRWHINFCPGWKMYFSSLPPEEKAKIADKYNLVNST
jgi:hypothetical protein